MVAVELFHSDDEIPPLPPADESALYFSPAARTDFLQQIARHARQENRQIFIAKEDDKVVSLGMMQVHSVISANGAIRLSESHASHQRFSERHGLKPHLLSETLIESMFAAIERHKDRVIPEHIDPKTRWRGVREGSAR